jgi:NADPH:quinone reductase
MKAILLRRPGGSEALEYVEVPTPVPGEGKVLVKADTIGVSMPEVLVRRGTYAWMPPLPAIPGIELSGTVVAHGPNTAEPALGQSVFVHRSRTSQKERNHANNLRQCNGRACDDAQHARLRG